MKYFLDTEFIEGFNKPLFGKKRHFIDLISIGIVCEDGRSLYLISNEYDYNKADAWVKENVILPMYIDTVHGDMRNNCDVNNFHKIYGKSNHLICTEIMKFIWHEQWDEWIGLSDEFFERGRKYGWDYGSEIEFYGYYSDYDWVLFCSFFGRMIDLPKDFPMYCKDLKQMFDEKAESLSSIQLTKLAYPKANHDVYEYVDNQKFNVSKINALKTAKGYPKQKKEHNALDDAKWNFELFKFLKSL